MGSQVYQNSATISGIIQAVRTAITVNQTRNRYQSEELEGVISCTALVFLDLLIGSHYIKGIIGIAAFYILKACKAKHIGIYLVAVVYFINSEYCIGIHTGKAVTITLSGNDGINIAKSVGYCLFLTGKTVQLAQFSKNYLT